MGDTRGLQRPPWMRFGVALVPRGRVLGGIVILAPLCSETTEIEGMGCQVDASWAPKWRLRVAWGALKCRRGPTRAQLCRL